MSGLEMSGPRISNLKMSSFERSGLQMSDPRISDFRINGLEKIGLKRTNSIWHYDGHSRYCIGSSKDLPACFCIEFSIIVIILYILFVIEILLQFSFSRY